MRAHLFLSLIFLMLGSLFLWDLRAATVSELSKEIAAIELELERLPLREPGETGGTAGIYVERSGESSSSITVDLGKVFPIDRIVLVPTRLLNIEGEREQVGFPVRFDILGSVSGDFDSPTVFYAGQQSDFGDPKGYPVLFDGNGAATRFVRIVVYDFPQVKLRRAVSFAELFVFSKGRNVAVGRSVEAEDSIPWEGVFDAAFLVDGQTTYGQPIEYAEWEPRIRGWHAKVRERAGSEEFVELRLQNEREVDEIRLYPVYHSLWPYGTDYGFPVHFQLEVHQRELGPRTVADWSEQAFPRPGNSPVYFALENTKIDAVRLRALRLPESIPSRYVFALAELEVYSDGLNIAPEGEVVSSSLHRFNVNEWNEEALTDGYATRGRILPLSEWLEGLAKRGQLEARLGALKIKRAEAQQRFNLHLRITVAVLSISLLVAGGLLIFNRSKRRKQLHDLRNQIAADLHDDVGSNLASITILAAGASEQCGAGSEQAKTLQRLVDIAKETSASMRDIVWMLHPSRKSSTSLTSRLKDIASGLLAETNYTFEGSEEVEADELSVDRLHHFLLFYKEALHNLARHGGPSEVRILVQVFEGKIRIQICDDGARPRGGSLPEGLKLRAEKLGGTLTFESDGTVNELTLIF